MEPQESRDADKQCDRHAQESECNRLDHRHRRLAPGRRRTDYRLIQPLFDKVCDFHVGNDASGLRFTFLVRLLVVVWLQDRSFRLLVLCLLVKPLRDRYWLSCGGRKSGESRREPSTGGGQSFNDGYAEFGHFASCSLETFSTMAVIGSDVVGAVAVVGACCSTAFFTFVHINRAVPSSVAGRTLALETAGNVLAGATVCAWAGVAHAQERLAHFAAVSIGT